MIVAIGKRRRYTVGARDPAAKVFLVGMCTAGNCEAYESQDEHRHAQPIHGATSLIVPGFASKTLADVAVCKGVKPPSVCSSFASVWRNDASVR